MTAASFSISPGCEMPASRDSGPIEEGCGCEACGGGFSRGYLRHLFLAEEMLGPILISLHNIAHFQRLMADLRQAVVDDDWARLAANWPVLSGGTVAVADDA